MSRKTNNMSRLILFSFFFILLTDVSPLLAQDNEWKTTVIKVDKKEQVEKTKNVNCSSIDSQMPLPQKKIQ